MVVEEWRPVMKQAVIRAICDALGFTNLPPDRKAHKDAVREAQAWFLSDDEAENFDLICSIAGVDATKIKSVARLLINAKFTGEYSRLPEFWQIVLRENRHPNLTNIERALDRMKKPR